MEEFSDISSWKAAGEPMRVGVLFHETYGFWVGRGKYLDFWYHRDLALIDLSPLSRFLPAPEGVRLPLVWETGVGDTQAAPVAIAPEEFHSHHNRLINEPGAWWRVTNRSDRPVAIPGHNDWILPPGHCLFWDRATMRHLPAKMYGWPFEPEETPQPKKPEPTIAEKALEDFMQKRMRARMDSPQKSDEDWAKRQAEMAKDKADSESLGNAMSKLTHWELTLHERIVPYRVAQ